MMKLLHFLELLCFLVMGNVTRAGIDPSGRNSTETVPNSDAIEAGKGLISILFQYFQHYYITNNLRMSMGNRMSC